MDIIDTEILEHESDDLDVDEDCNQSLFLTKDQLPNSNCCRFCGFGGRNELDSSSLDSQFIPIYEKPFESALETLDYTINRYLPIKVYENDPYYPKVICSSCYECFERTTIFFDKITEGQELLSKIINQLNEVKKAILTDKVIPKLDFSDENPILNAKRRRGRPRKDPNKLKIPKAPMTVSIAYLERSKRHTRPPARYVVSSLCATEVKEEVSDAIKETDNGKKDEFLAFLADSNSDAIATMTKSDSAELQSKVLNKTQGDTSLTKSLDSDFPNLTGMTRRESLMDLAKLDVIMDEDEEIDTSVLQLENNDSSLLKGNKVISSLPTSALVHEEPTSESLQVQTDSTEKNIQNNDIEIIQEPDEDENGDSDASVKLIDLIRSNRKSVRKKQKVKSGRKPKGRVRVRPVRQINCPDCDKKFSHPSSLLYHRAAVHDQIKKYVCSTCKKGFSHKQLLTNHLYTHFDEKFFSCDLCTSKFKSRASLYTHRKSVHTSKKEFTCEKCGFQFTLKSSLKTHMRLHTGEKPYSCEFCHKTFAQASNMKEHRRTHTGERPYVCPTPNCDKAFTTASQLRNHKFTHSGLRPYLCSVCGKAFANNENFKYHMRRHNGHRPLKCPLCHKQFIEPWAFKKHWRLHTGEKPYECGLCNKVFSDPSNFSKHKKMHIEPVPTTVDHPDEFQIQVQAVYDTTDIPTSGETVVTEEQDNTIADLGDIIPGTSHIVTENADLNGESEAHSLAQILNGERFTAIEGSSQDGQSSVIYVCSGEVPVYTITIADNEQTIEVRAEDEAALHQALGSLAGGNITFAAVDPGEINSDYFDLETTVEGSTAVTVPVPQLASNLSTVIISPSTRRESDDDGINIDAD